VSTSFFFEQAPTVLRGKSEMDDVTSADLLMKVAPDYYRDRFEAIADLRKIDDGTLHRGNEFRRVASLVNVPMWDVMNVLDPTWMKDKRRFYDWLSKHPEYRTYDKRGGSRPQITYLDGKAVGGADG